MKAIETKIGQIPQELSKLYKELLKEVDDDDMQQSLWLMQWICFGVRPLSLKELRFAMTLDASPLATTIIQCQKTEIYVETDELIERRVPDLSKGLAEIVRHRKHRVVQFIHQSVIDFLGKEGFQLLEGFQREANAGVFAGRSHFQLPKACIRYLAMGELQQRCDRIDRKRLDLEFPFLEYSVNYWIVHAKKCERERQSASDLLLYFETSGSYRVSLLTESDYPNTAVHIASRYNLLLALNDLLNQDVEADAKDMKGRTPLSRAAEMGHETIVRMLVDREDVKTDSKDNSSPRPQASTRDEAASFTTACYQRG